MLPLLVALTSVALTAPAVPSPDRFEWITLPNGVTLRYLEQGPDTGSPLVLLHGITDSWQSWSLVLPHLPASQRVIAVDFRGHGASSRPSRGYAVADFAEDVALLLERLDLAGVTIVGHSLGSQVARDVARRAPHRVSRLVLVGSTPSTATPLVHELSRVIDGFGEEIPASFVEEFQRSTIHLPVPDAFLADVIAASHGVPARVWREAFRALVTWDDRDRLAALRLPTVLIWGENDAIFSLGDQEELLRGIPGSYLVSYPETGHAPHWERPREFAQDLLAFLQGDLERR